MSRSVTVTIQVTTWIDWRKFIIPLWVSDDSGSARLQYSYKISYQEQNWEIKFLYYETNLAIRIFSHFISWNGIKAFRKSFEMNLGRLLHLAKLLLMLERPRDKSRRLPFQRQLFFCPRLTIIRYNITLGIRLKSILAITNRMILHRSIFDPEWSQCIRIRGLTVRLQLTFHG